ENECKQDLPMEDIGELNTSKAFKPKPQMVTIGINGGRKDKLRAGDILGALTANQKIAGSAIGKIDRFDRLTYVAVDRRDSNTALDLLTKGKIKGRQFKARFVK
ncbi:MAG: DbpA RNA binding domain-containing protein, partial [Kangiellaceae bacterium]|nr:DbpA RNA binding domain-containing protein [Kangiellaceae bacterium]